MWPKKNIYNVIQPEAKLVISITWHLSIVDLNFFTIKFSAKLLNVMERLDLLEEEIQICTSEVDLSHEGASRGPKGGRIKLFMEIVSDKMFL